MGWWVGGWVGGWAGGVLNLRTAFPKGALVAEKTSLPKYFNFFYYRMHTLIKGLAPGGDKKTLIFMNTLIKVPAPGGTKRR